MHMRARKVAILAGLIGAESAAQYFLQKAADKRGGANLAAGAATYAVVGVIYYMLLRTGTGLAMANSIWNAGTEISIAVVGWAFFQQRLSMKQVIGVVIALIGIQLLASP